MSLFHAGIGFAAGDTRALSSGLENMGIVDSVHPNGQEIVINDQAYPVVKYVRVHGLNGRNISVQRLSSGNRVRFATSTQGEGGRPAIIELWLLSDNN